MIIWNGPVFEPSGYGRASRDYLLALINNKVDLGIINTRYSYKNNINYFSDGYKIISDFLIEEKDIKDNCVYIHHATPYELRSCPIASNNIAYTVWETDRLPNLSYRFNEFNHILTCSEFSKNAFINYNSNLNVGVVPHIIRQMNTNYNEKFKHDELNDKFVFFSNFEWHLGKGYDILLECFVETFIDNPDVILVIKTFNLSSSFYKNSIINYIKEIKSKFGNCVYPKILPLIGSVSDNVISSLYSVADVCVSCSRREAFGLFISESVASGIPIITPDKGGHTEFLPSNNLSVKSSLVDIPKLEVERSLYANQKWVEMDKKSLKDVLHKCYYDKDYFESIKIQFHYLKNHVLGNFSEYNVFNILNKYIKE